MKKWEMTHGPKVVIQKWGHACGLGVGSKLTPD